MEPIISPWIFYFIGVGSNIQIASGILALVFGMITFVTIVASNRSFKTPLIATTIFVIMTAFIPNKEICYQMVAASVCTTDNINTVIDGGKNLVDYIIDSVSEVEEIERDVKEKEYNSKR